MRMWARYDYFNNKNTILFWKWSKYGITNHKSVKFSIVGVCLTFKKKLLNRASYKFEITYYLKLVYPIITSKIGPRICNSSHFGENIKHTELSIPYQRGIWLWQNFQKWHLRDKISRRLATMRMWARYEYFVTKIIISFWKWPKYSNKNHKSAKLSIFQGGPVRAHKAAATNVKGLKTLGMMADIASDFSRPSREITGLLPSRGSSPVRKGCPRAEREFRGACARANELSSTPPAFGIPRRSTIEWWRAASSFTLASPNRNKHQHRLHRLQVDTGVHRLRNSTICYPWVYEAPSKIYVLILQAGVPNCEQLLPNWLFSQASDVLKNEETSRLEMIWPGLPIPGIGTTSSVLVA